MHTLRRKQNGAHEPTSLGALARTAAPTRCRRPQPTKLSSRPIRHVTCFRAILGHLRVGICAWGVRAGKGEGSKVEIIIIKTE
jgi:hypothetical protein